MFLNLAKKLKLFKPSNVGFELNTNWSYQNHPVTEFHSAVASAKDYKVPSGNDIPAPQISEANGQP